MLLLLCWVVVAFVAKQQDTQAPLVMTGVSFIHERDAVRDIFSLMDINHTHLTRPWPVGRCFIDTHHRKRCRGKATTEYLAPRPERVLGHHYGGSTKAIRFLCSNSRQVLPSRTSELRRISKSNR